jgi:hypothetical protein
MAGDALQELNEAGLSDAWAEHDVNDKLDLRALAGEFPDVWAEAAVDHEAGTFTVRYNENAPQDRVDQFLRRIANANEQAPALQIVSKAVTFSAAELDAEIQVILEAPDVWSGRLGLPDIVLLVPDYETGVITVGTSGAEPAGGYTGTFSSGAGFPLRVEWNAEIRVSMDFPVD